MYPSITKEGNKGRTEEQKRHEIYRKQNEK